jgi:hypothetical protein
MRKNQVLDDSVGERFDDADYQERVRCWKSVYILGFNSPGRRVDVSGSAIALSSALLPATSFRSKPFSKFRNFSPICLGLGVCVWRA